MTKSTKKVPQKSATKYNENLAINGTFEEVVRLSVAGNPAPLPKPVKPPKKK